MEIRIEEDIKRCKKLTEPQNANWIGISNQLAIAGALARIQELEEENKRKDMFVEMAKEVIENSILKQKVKDLKESIILDNTIVGGRRNAKTLEYGIKLGKIKACEELLEDK